MHESRRGSLYSSLCAAEADFLSSAINLSERFFRLGTEGRYSVTIGKRFLLVVCFYCSIDISNVLIQGDIPRGWGIFRDLPKVFSKFPPCPWVRGGGGWIGAFVDSCITRSKIRPDEKFVSKQASFRESRPTISVR